MRAIFLDYATVSFRGDLDPAALRRALPGVELRVVQCYPACIFRIGHAEFAVDEQMAAHVRVHRLA